MPASPALVFDAARLERNIRMLADAAQAHGVTALFAAKSFPHPHVRALAAAHLHGFDAASEAEVRELAEVATTGILSIADPTGRAAASPQVASWRGRVIVSCESLDQIRAAPAGADIALRLSASLTARDPAVGAVLDGSGHRRSRFGLDVDRDRRRGELRAMVEAARAAASARRIGLHVHHGPVTATSAERFVATLRAALAAAADADFAPAFVDVGGAWHGIADIAAAFAALRAAADEATGPRPHASDGLELIVEPGRALADGAGFARGTVVAARELDDRPLRVLDLSRICHLRWSPVELVAQAPHPGEGRRALFVGPTCFEDDVVGEWSIEPARLGAGARVVLRGVTGYAVAWNTSFGGVPAASVLVGDAERLLE